MFGLFNRFGRSTELRRLDTALRAAGVHPALVPEAVKLATVRLLAASRGPTPEACAEAAALLGYCMLGPDGYADATDAETAAMAARRVDLAAEAGDGLDARLVLLALHAGIAAADTVDRHGLEAG